METGALTLDALCDGLRQGLTRAVADHRDSAKPIPPLLRLSGVPGDDVMRSLLKAAGGKLTIEVVSTVQETAEVTEEVAAWQPEGVNLSTAGKSPRDVVNNLGQQFIEWRRELAGAMSGCGIHTPMKLDDPTVVTELRQDV